MNGFLQILTAGHVLISKRHEHDLRTFEIERTRHFIKEGIAANSNPNLRFSNVKNINFVSGTPIGLFRSRDMKFPLFAHNSPAVDNHMRAVKHLLVPFDQTKSNARIVALRQADNLVRGSSRDSLSDITGNGVRDIACNI